MTQPEPSQKNDSYLDLGVLPSRLDEGIAERAAIGLIVLASDQTMEHEFRHVDLLNLFTFLVGEAVGEHPHAERARAGDGVGAGRQELIRPHVVHAGIALFFFLEHLRAAGAAAQTAIARLLRLEHGQPGHRAEYIARSVVHLVVAAQVA